MPSWPAGDKSRNYAFVIRGVRSDGTKNVQVSRQLLLIPCALGSLVLVDQAAVGSSPCVCAAHNRRSAPLLAVGNRYRFSQAAPKIMKATK